MSYSHLSQHIFSRTNSANRRTWLLAGLAAVLLTFATLATVTVPQAAAAISDDEELAKFGGLGAGAGQLILPDGVATDPVTGHVYVAEEGLNNRISEFTPWGNFVKAFGWDVAPGAVNEQQEVRVRAAGGQFKLTFKAFPTPDLAFNAPGSESEGPGSVEAALNALPSIDQAGGEVSVEAVPGTPDGKTPFIYVVAFKGSLAGTDVDQLTIANGTTPLNGGVPSSSFEMRTRADGTPSSVGLESCTTESGCKAGLIGGGAGQLARARGVAVDLNGNVYVREVTNLRVQKFDSAGRFVLMAGGEVNKTKSSEVGSSEAERNLCAKASGDECGTGIAGTGPAQFASTTVGGITLCSGALFVADKDRIQRLNLEGGFQAELPQPGESVSRVACDPLSGDLYMTFEAGVSVVRLNPSTGEEISENKLEAPGGIATDPAGNLFVVSQGEVLEFDSAGESLSPPSCCGASPFGLENLGTNSAGDLYVSHASSGSSFIRSFGPAPVIFEAAPPVPPSITGQFATSVDRTSAVVGAEINPHFWSDTRYYVEYGTGKCSEGGCEATKPIPPGSILSSKTVNAPLKSAGIALEGLEPGATYHYRFVAKSTGGGPVRGIGGEVGVDGEESAFTTYPAATAPKTDCPNQLFRTGFSAPLPDCRAFEMVSPIDKNNGDIKALLDSPSYSDNLTQSATEGNRFTYTAARSFANPKGAPYTSQYFARRVSGSGWSSESLSVSQRSILTVLNLENPYKAFSPDLCTSWLMVRAEPVLAPGATEGYADLYRSDKCGSEGYEALIQVEPTIEKAKAQAFVPVLQGTSADGREAIFTVEDKLTEDAASDRWQSYFASDGALRPLCFLPNGTPSGGHCSPGTSDMAGAEGGFPQLERLSSVTHAISADGNRVYWTDSASNESGPGKVYLRLKPGEEQSEVSSGECTEPEKACTLKVSETISGKASRFLGASADGSKALFEFTEGAQKGSLYLFELEAGGSTLIAAKGLGVAGASEDLSHVYFVSEEALPETSGASAGKPNLYLEEEGTKTFVATLSKGDVSEGEALSNNHFKPILHAARATADGSHLTFISTGSLTGYDNTDQLTGEADFEVYLYEAGAAGPVCISCNPSGARPQGRVVRFQKRTAVPLAALIPPPQFILNEPRVLSSEGDRLFFNSFDALLPRDTNGKEDVYEWEAASSSKECKELGAELYVPSSGGCLSLISTGQSPSDSEFLDASGGGKDVFFTTNSSLLPQDPGLVDVYDAREGGGLPAPPEPPGPCQGEACQNAVQPPNDPTPASASFKGAGNLRPTPRCAKGKVARKGRCVAKKRKGAKKQRRAENNKRRSAR